MRRRSSTFRVASFTALLGGLAAVSSIEAQGHDRYDRHRTGTLFKRKCQRCHTVPDPKRSEFDRAWLDQIHRTA